MNILPSIFIIALLSLMTTAFGAGQPAYPNQPNINLALRKLTEAQELLQSGRSEDEIKVPLKKAQEAREMAINNKGSFRGTAIRLTGQAIKHLEKRDKSTLAHAIQEVIDATHKAGQAGAK